MNLCHCCAVQTIKFAEQKTNAICVYVHLNLKFKAERPGFVVPLFYYKYHKE